VQLPFLQRTLSQFKIVPLVFGQVDPAKAASVLEETLDDSTLLIVSSDLSHYDTYANAKRRDQTCIDSILQLKPEAISTNDACGAIPIQTLLAIAKSRGWTPVLLDYRNSGDTTGETEQGVVGYAAVAFYAESEPPRLFSAAQHDDMLHLARSTLNAVRNKSANDPTPRTKDDPLLEQPRGCFVTLKLHGRLRGCMGNITPSEPLAKAIVSNTRLAALRDPRFEPVSRAEIPEIEIEISVLTQPTPVAFESSEELLEKITPGKDGILLQIGNKSATYLPQVWEQLPDKVEFFNSLAEKAGCPAAAWHDKNTKVFTYQVESFKETARP
jgi:AmmeMemoRadiSam system protein A